LSKGCLPGFHDDPESVFDATSELEPFEEQVSVFVKVEGDGPYLDAYLITQRIVALSSGTMFPSDITDAQMGDHEMNILDDDCVWVKHSVLPCERDYFL
jgi:hypothetical protein